MGYVLFGIIPRLVLGKVYKGREDTDNGRRGEPIKRGTGI
jgi:hypothetical protein